MIYAGFWRRAIAFIVDSLIVQCIVGLFSLFLPVNMSIHKYFFKEGDFSNFSIDMGSMKIQSPQYMEISYPQDSESFFAYLLMIAITWLYYTLFQSSQYQATLGMKLFGMRITDYAGNRVSFGQATLRYVASWLSGVILMIGYIMIAFTPRKQALHDYIAKTLVVKN